MASNKQPSFIIALRACTGMSINPETGLPETLKEFKASADELTDEDRRWYADAMTQAGIEFDPNSVIKVAKPTTAAA
jgi:hypothetical protein